MMMKLPDYGDGSERVVHGDEEEETGTGTGSDLDRHIGRMGMGSQVSI